MDVVQVQLTVPAGNGHVEYVVDKLEQISDRMCLQVGLLIFFLHEIMIFATFLLHDSQYNTLEIAITGTHIKFT